MYVPLISRSNETGVVIDTLHPCVVTGMYNITKHLVQRHRKTKSTLSKHSTSCCDLKSMWLRLHFAIGMPMRTFQPLRWYAGRRR